MTLEIAKLAGRIGGATILAILVMAVIREGPPLSQLPWMVAFALVGAVLLAVPMVLWKRRRNAAKGIDSSMT